jgi:hypothetical protein
MLAEPFAGTAPDVTEENIQARCRGMILMAISNKKGQDGAHHRQQERDVGGLRHPLRRHGRRLRAAEGRAKTLVYNWPATATASPR